MKKILFVSTRDPFSGRYSGDVIRSLKIINILKKKFQVDVVYLGNKPTKQDKNIFFYSLKYFHQNTLLLYICNQNRTNTIWSFFFQKK